jgi:hypothetical protein
MCYSATVITFVAMVLLTAQVGFYEIEICEPKEEEEEETEEETTLAIVIVVVGEAGSS